MRSAKRTLLAVYQMLKQDHEVFRYLCMLEPEKQPQLHYLHLLLRGANDFLLPTLFFLPLMIPVIVAIYLSNVKLPHSADFAQLGSSPLLLFQFQFQLQEFF